MYTSVIWSMVFHCFLRGKKTINFDIILPLTIIQMNQAQKFWTENHSLLELKFHYAEIWEWLINCMRSPTYMVYNFVFLSLSPSISRGLLLFFFLPQHAVVVSTSLPPRTSSALVVQCTASTTAKAPGAATARTVTTEHSLTLRLWPAQVSLPCRC